MGMTIDSRDYRKMLGHYPTGVCAVMAILDGDPVGMVVGSFTSVSLDPPLIAFLPGRTSTSWPKIKAAGRFCVNILADDQGAVCKTFTSRDANRFDALSYRLSDMGSPIIDGVAAWIDCDLEAVHEAGDHFISIGRVEAMEVESTAHPLVFCRGGFGQFTPQPSVW